MTWIQRHTLLFVAVITAIASPAVAWVPAPRDSAQYASAARVLRLESVEVQGNKRTRTTIVLRHLAMSPGDAVDVDALDAARERLLATNYFKDVQFSTRPGMQRGDVVLVVDVVERGYPQFETGFGYDDLYGWFVTILGVRFDNTFGPENRLRIGWRFGFRISGIDARWDKPLGARGQWGVGAIAYAYNLDQLFYASSPVPPGNSDPNAVRRFSQQIQRGGGEGLLRYNPTRNTQLSFGLVAEVAEPDSGFSNRENDIDYGYAELPLSLQQDAGRTNLNGVFMRVIRDTRDDVDYPRSGSLNIVRVRFNATELGSDREYAKGIVDLRKHFGLGERSVISTRLHGGVTGQAAPYYDRFYIGGIYSIRGFAEWSLSPAGGDEAFWTGSAEFRFPLTFSGTGQPRVTGLLFADVGQGFVSTPGQSRLSSSLDEVQAGVGYGVRIKIPWLGTLGVDGAVPLTPGRTGDPYRIHLSLGFSF